MTSAAAGNNCPSGGSDTRCSTTVQVLVPGLTVTVSAGTASTTAGSTVHYTVIADNTGQTTDTGVSFTDALAGVLDDAVLQRRCRRDGGQRLVHQPEPVLDGDAGARGDGDDHVLGDGATAPIPGTRSCPVR